MRTQGVDGHLQTKERGPTTPWIYSLQDCEKIHFCCVSLPGCGALSGQLELTNAATPGGRADGTCQRGPGMEGQRRQARGPQKESGGERQDRRAHKAVINSHRILFSLDALGYCTSLHFADFRERNGDK